MLGDGVLKKNFRKTSGNLNSELRIGNWETKSQWQSAKKVTKGYKRLQRMEKFRVSNPDVKIGMRHFKFRVERQKPDKT